MTLRITRESLLDGSMRARLRAYARTHPDMRGRSEAEMAALLEQTLEQHDPAADLWVFGYGSLIWNPAFMFVERQPALLHGWHRRFCLKMYVARGTPENPGLMLALDRGGACRGLAFRIAAADVRQELGLLWQREMYGGAYNARWVTLNAAGTALPAITFVVNATHPRYVRALSVAQTASLIATASGDLGTCREYLENTISHLRALGVRDAGLARIEAALPKC